MEWLTCASVDPESSTIFVMRHVRLINEHVIAYVLNEHAVLCVVVYGATFNEQLRNNSCKHREGKEDDLLVSVPPKIILDFWIFGGKIPKCRK